MKRLVAIWIGVLAASALGAEAPSAVFTPTYKTRSGEIYAGKAFVARMDRCKQPILVSAVHLFGPMGGLEKQLTAQELASQLQEIELTSISDPDSRLSFKALSFTPAEANPCCGSEPMSGVGDVAAFQAPSSMAPAALAVSASTSRPGDHVFVVTSLVDRDGPPFKFEAIVRGTVKGHLIYDYVDSGLVLQATSGAPVIDGSGRVVAINLGGRQEAAGRVMGIGNPTTNWREQVERLCAK